jgi:hypothetical protein
MNNKKIFKISLLTITGAIVIGAIIALIVTFSVNDAGEIRNNKR